jgi:pentatricopeptide repeat protein
VVALYLLGFSVFWIADAYVATTLGADEFFSLIPLLVVGAATLVLASGIRLVELVVGRMCTTIGDTLLRKEKWQAASGVLGVARRLLPSDRRVARNQGLALYEQGEAEQALPILVEAYEQGERDKRLIRTLADSALQLPEDLACNILNEALKVEPNNAKVGRRLVEIHLRGHRPADAVPVLEKFYDSDNLEDVCLLGRLNAEQGNIERALQLARRAMELEGQPYKRTLADLQILAMQAPDNPQVLLTLAELNERVNNREEAASWYLNLLEVQAENTDARRRLIRHYRELGRVDQALPHYRALLRQQPDSPDAALEYGQVLEDRQDFDKALKVFQDFSRRYPRDHRFAYHCAVNLFGLRRLDEAATALEQARIHAPESERPRVQTLAARIQAARVEIELGALRKRAEQPDAPLQLRLEYIERLTSHQQADEAARQIDLLLEDRPGDRNRIVKSLENLVDRGESHFVLLNILAGIYLKERDFDRCHSLYEMMAQQSLHPDEILSDGCRQILRVQPNHLPSLKSHSSLLIKSGHHREAARVMSKILDLSPSTRANLLPMLFEVYYKMGDPDRAIPYGEELLKSDSQNLNLYLRLRELFDKRDDHRGAIQILQRALNVAPDNRQIKEMLDESKRRLKESRLEQLLAQLENAPEDPALLHQVADIYVEFGRLNDAITAFQRAAQHAEGNLRNLAQIKLANCLANKQMFDLADETLRELQLTERDPEHLADIKHYLYELAGLFELDEQYARALSIYKKVFKLDAGYEDIVNKIEMLSHLVR